MLLSLPTRVQITKKKFFALNLNHYRNTHFTQLNNAKIAFKSAVQKRVCALPELHGQIHFTYILYPKTRQKCDVANVCSIVDKFFSDALVEFGIIPDDNYDHLPQVIYQFGSIDKANPRVDVLIETYPDYLARITQPQIKEQDPMQITLNETEIKRAISEFITNRMEVDLNTNVDIDLKATRGSEGFTASFDVLPRVKHTEARLSGEAQVAAPLDKPSETSNVGSTADTPEPVKAAPKAVAKSSLPATKPVAEPSTTEEAPAADKEVAGTTTKAFAGQSSGEKPKSLFAAKAAAQEAEQPTEESEANISSGDERTDPTEAADTPIPSEPSTEEVDETEQQQEEEEDAPAPEPAKKPLFSFAKKA
jgi:hypothetical protein